VNDTTADDRIPGRDQAVFRVQPPCEHDPQQGEGKDIHPILTHLREKGTKAQGISPIKAGFLSGDPPPDGSEYRVYEPGICRPPDPYGCTLRPRTER